MNNSKPSMSIAAVLLTALVLISILVAVAVQSLRLRFWS